MKAFGYQTHGGPEVFNEYDIAEPVVNDQKVKIKTIKFGINNYDVDQRKQLAKIVAGKPYIPGLDVVGEITEVGGDDDQFKVGDLVVARGLHTYAQSVVAKKTNVAKLANDQNLNEAVGMVTSGIAAYNIVHSFAEIKPAMTIVVQGASGGVGSIVTQLLARFDNLKIIGIASSKNATYVQSLGVDQFIAYDQVNLAQELNSVADIVIDTSLNGAGLNSDMAMLKAGGQLLMAAGVEQPANDKNIQFIPVGFTDKFTEGYILKELVSLLEKDQLQIRISKVMPFELASVIQGHQLMEQHPQGRIIIGQ